MAILKFENFIFDSKSYHLTHKGRPVPLRPKALRLLKLLIENRERIVGKPEIFTSIWGSPYVRDHLLFQLISELRKTPLDRDFIRTQPNQGYQWNVETKVVHAKNFSAAQLAACILIGLVSINIASLPNTTVNKPQSLIGLPAHSAFSKGVIALENGDKDLAEDWFKFALNENPESVESSLFLAETLLQQNKPEESSEKLLELLKKPNLDAYNQMTISNLLSRINQRQGRLGDALRYARNSVQPDIIGRCSVDAVEQRIEMLEERLGSFDAVSKPDLQQVASNRINDRRQSKTYQDQCSQLQPDIEETSQCEPLRTELHYVDGRNEIFGDIS